MPNAAERKDAHASPLQASLEQLEGQASALIITCENDVLRYEGEAYAHKLALSGVRYASRPQRNRAGQRDVASGAVQM